MGMMQAGLLAFGSGGAAPTYATWNAADKSSTYTLSNGNLTAAKNSASAGGVRSNQGKTSGKWYWEVKYSAGSTLLCGVATSSWTLTTALGSDANSISYNSGGTVTRNGATLFTGTAYTTANTIGFAYDADAATLAIYRDNTLQGTVTSVGSGSFAATSSAFATNTLVANFGATALTYTPPSGFNAGLYT